MFSNVLNILAVKNYSYESVELAKAFLVFLAFSFIGWICEVLYVGIFFEHKFVNRGFLHGPICPVYGLGGILILSLPEKLQSPVWVLFLSGLFFCSIVEYISSYALEKMFHAKWWDYSERVIHIGKKTISTNINGRVCLRNSILFGFMTVGVIRYVQPLIVKAFSFFNDVSLLSVSNLLAAGLILDLIATLHKLVDFSVYIMRLKDFGETLKERYSKESWFRSGSLTEMFESVKKRAEHDKNAFSAALLEKLENAAERRVQFEKFLRRFPTAKSYNFREVLEHLKEKRIQK